MGLANEDFTIITEPPENKFGMRDKIGYMLGDFGNDFFFILVAAFLMVFYTDVFHVSPAFVGMLFLVARIWDAIADVTWGRIVDAAAKKADGDKFRPWIFKMSFPLVIVGVLMFVQIPGMSTGFYEAYAFVTYILWGTLYSTVNIPYGSMASVITQDPVERTSLSTYRTLGSTLAGLIVGVIGPLILFVDNEAVASRFLVGAIVLGVLSLACYMGCYKMTTERIKESAANKPKLNLKQTLKGLLRNKPLLWILTASLVFLVCQMLTQVVNVYLFKDYFQDAHALSIVGIIGICFIFVAMPMVKPLVLRFGKKEVASAGLLLATAVYSILYFMPNLSLMTFIVLIAVGTFGFSFFNLVIWAFVTDVIDYHEYLTGLREDGTVYSIYSFARKIGQAIAGGLGGFVIAAVGYNEHAATQTKETLDGIYALATLVPAILFLIIFVVLLFLYPLNKDRTNQLVKDLEEKRLAK